MLDPKRQAMIDQNLAALAEGVAGYYRCLQAEGVPVEQATLFAVHYQTTVLVAAMQQQPKPEQDDE